MNNIDQKETEEAKKNSSAIIDVKMFALSDQPTDWLTDWANNRQTIKPILLFCWMEILFEWPREPPSQAGQTDRVINIKIDWVGGWFWALRVLTWITLWIEFEG